MKGKKKNMTSNQKHFSNNDGTIVQSTAKYDSNPKLLSKAETLYVSLMCFVTSCLSSVTFEVGARSPLGHSVTKSATFNALFRHMIIKIPMGNFVASLISTIILTLGEKYRIPYFYLPWMVNTIKGMVFNEGPALVSLSYNQLPYAVIPASTFGFMTMILFVEEICLWYDVFASFRRCWIEYSNEKEQTKKKENSENMISVVNEKNEANVYKCKHKNHDRTIHTLEIKAKNIYEPDMNTLLPYLPKKSFKLSDLRQTKSLMAIN